MTQISRDVLINRHDLSDLRVVPGMVGPDSALVDGQILVAVEQFALSANNISYALSGDLLGYWNFFPTDDPSDGRVPVWGYASVLASRHPDLAEGERIFGYWPMSTHAVLTPSQVDAATFTESAHHRAGLHQWYNRYFRCAGDPVYDPAHHDLQPGLWALFMTGWLLADFLAVSRFFGGRQVVIASASSKTAYSLAWSLAALDERVAVVGLTSPGNRAFVEQLGCYDRVVTYDDLAALGPAAPAVFVDMAGNAQVRLAVHRWAGDGLVYSCLVGGTHQGGGATDEALPGPAPQFFFVPDHAEGRAGEWGRAEFTSRFGTAWRQFAGDASARLRIDHRHGVESIESAYLDVLASSIAPDTSVLVTL